MFSKALCVVLLGLCFSVLAVEAAPHRGGYARSAVGNGNTHVRIEELDSLDHDLRTFKDVDRAIVNDAVVTTNVAKGLLVGARQADSIDSAANHQPVLQPTAQRGSQDDNATFAVVASKSAAAESISATATVGTFTTNVVKGLLVGALQVLEPTAPHGSLDDPDHFSVDGKQAIKSSVATESISATATAEASSSATE